MFIKYGDGEEIKRLSEKYLQRLRSTNTNPLGIMPLDESNETRS